MSVDQIPLALGLSSDGAQGAALVVIVALLLVLGLLKAAPAAGAARRRSWLSAIVIGKDNRSSTSKTVAFMWTLAVAYGLLSLMIAEWFGADADAKAPGTQSAWDAQLAKGLQEEYLLLLGGPYAAAVLAKAVTAGRTDTKTDAATTGVSASPAQLVSDDEGSTDLVDFQYVLFNGIALAFFLGAFIPDVERGFPELPALLTGLALTSVAGYSAKKLISEARPRLVSVLPVAGPPGTTVHIYATSLTIPTELTAVADTKPIVSMGAHRFESAAVTHGQVLGNDRISVVVPDGLPAGPAPISVARADGVIATTEAGAALALFDVVAGPPPTSGNGAASSQAGSAGTVTQPNP